MKKFIFKSFIVWRILLFIFLFFAISTIALQRDFLGGGLLAYLKEPYLWAWANFDGEHYLSIAYQGYLPLTYFFFPIYPLITKVVALPFGGGLKELAISGLIVSNISFLIALFGIWKLILLDYKEKVAKLTIVLLLLFPTAFYFGSVYTESIFLALTVWSLYFARKNKWLKAGILGGLLTATRIVGVAIIPALLIEAWLQKKKDKSLNLLCPVLALLLTALGIIGYMYFLKVETGDPLEFFHNISIFGQQRTAGLVILPQVFYRYFFKILPSINYSYFPVVFVSYLEIITAFLFLVLTIMSFFKLRLTYVFYLAIAYIIPTFSGSFSSFPRYALVLFPGFILLARWLSGIPKKIKTTFLLFFAAGLIIAISLFVRGYWVA